MFLTCSSDSSSADGAYNDLNAENELSYDAQMKKSPRVAIDQPKSATKGEASEIAEKIIRTADLSIEVNDVNQSKAEIDEFLQSFGAYYERESFSASDYRTNYNLVIRVPSEKFDALLLAIEGGEGFIQSKSINARSVTEEYIDVSIRLENSLKYLDQYNAILKKAKSIEEILEVREKIRTLEEEIEARKGRLQYLDDQVRLSTLHIDLFQRHKKSNQSKGFFAKIKDSIADGIRLFENIILLFFKMWPIILLLVLFYFLWRKKGWSFRRK